MLSRFLVHIVDADPAARAAACELLSGAGYDPKVHSDGDGFLREAPVESGCLLLGLAPVGAGADALQQELAGRGAELPVIVTAEPGAAAAVARAMKLGAIDYVEKPLNRGPLLRAVEAAHAAVSSREDRRGTSAAATARLERLSPRELQMLQGLLAGHSNKEIARRLGLSPRTVEMHRANMMDDLGTASLSEALRLAIDAGLPPLGETSRIAPDVFSSQRGITPAEEVRRSYENKLRLVLEASGDGAWEWTIPTGEIRLSARLVERLGYAPKDVPARFEGVEPFMHPDDWPSYRAALDAHLDGRVGSFASEFRIRRPDGAWAWFLSSGSVVDVDPAGAPVRMVGSMSDVTERKLQEARAAEAGELLRLAVWGAGAGVWELDLERRRIRLCARGRELHGMPADGPDIVAEDEWASAVHPADLAGAMAAIDRAVETGEPCSAEFRTVAPGGSVRRVLAIGKVVHDDAARPLRLVGLNQEVTEEGRRPLRLSASDAGS